MSQIITKESLTNNQTIILRDAKVTDAQPVARLADSIDLALTADPKGKGFLAANYTEADYKKFIEMADFSFVLTVDNEDIGFLVAYGSELVDPKDQFNNHIKENLSEKFVTVRQIFLSPKDEFRRKNYGSYLYKHLYERIIDNYKEKEENPRSVYADIVKTPVNIPSRDFHFSTGFEIVGEMTTSKDNRQRYIFCNNDIIQAKKDLEHRLRQHENKMNWLIQVGLTY